MDKFLTWVLDHLNKDTVLLICSDHGFSHVHTCVNMNNWLEKKGYVTMRTRKQGALKRILPSAERLQILLLRFGLRKLVNRLKRSGIIEPMIRRLIPSDRVQYLFDIEWSKVKVYFLDGSFGMMNVNLEGREPEGGVKGNEYEKVRDECIEELLKLTDPGTGTKVIKEAHKGENIYQGGSKNIPDIVLEVNDGYKLISAYNYNGNIFEEEKIRFGEHSKFGVFAAFGEGIRKGKELRDTMIYDIAPTILYILNMPISRDIDGKVIYGIFSERSGRVRERGRIREGDRGSGDDRRISERSVILKHVEKLTTKGRF